MTPAAHAFRSLAFAAVAPSSFAAPARADDPTWARDVAPILHAHCATCHRAGEVAPFPLLTFEDAEAHAEQIAIAVRERVMPPWLAAPGDPSLPPFTGERRLTDEQIATLERWAKAGAPSGDLASAPAPPEFTPGWQLAQPDLVVTMPEPYVLPAGGPDLYRNFVIAAPVDSMRHVRAVELRPGNPRVVHHAVIKLDKGDSSRRLDAKDPLPGFPEMESGEAVSPDGQFLGWTPGRVAKPLSEGMSWRLPPGSDLVVQLHLTPTGKPEPVQASVGLFFTDVTPTRLPFLIRLGSQAIDIPAGEARHEVTDSFTLPVAVELHAVQPHAHFLGRSVHAKARLPDGSEKTLIEIPRWDFSWQDEFRFERPIALPAGTTLSMSWIFDNSAENPRNPHSPPQRVRFGPSSSEEMCDVWIQVVPGGRTEFETLAREYAKKDLALLRAGFEARLAYASDDAEARLDLALTLMKQGDLAGGRRELERAVELAPQNVRARFHLGALLAREKGSDEGRGDVAKRARAELERVLELEPDHAAAMVELGMLCDKDGDCPAARKWFERAVALRPALFAGRVQLGRELDHTGEDAAAAAQYEAALAIDPSVVAVRRVLAWLRATSPDEGARNGEQALELARALVQLDPDEPMELDVLAAAQAESGRFRAAAMTAGLAIEAARRRGNDAFATAIESRRALYLDSRPYRESR